MVFSPQFLFTKSQKACKSLIYTVLPCVVFSPHMYLYIIMYPYLLYIDTCACFFLLYQLLIIPVMAWFLKLLFVTHFLLAWFLKLLFVTTFYFENSLLSIFIEMSGSIFIFLNDASKTPSLQKTQALSSKPGQAKRLGHFIGYKKS